MPICVFRIPVTRHKPLEAELNVVLCRIKSGQDLPAESRSLRQEPSEQEAELPGVRCHAEHGNE